jgi:hypothetical protein
VKRNITIVVIIAVMFAALLEFLLAWLFSPHHVERFELRVLQVMPRTNGSVQVLVLLTNGASVNLNVVDDSAGRPFMAYETGVGFRYGITPLANLLTINLAPGKCLTNTVTLTNAPAKFRLSCELRDLGAEFRIGSMKFIMPKEMARRFFESRIKEWDLPPPATQWIEVKTVTNKTSGLPQIRCRVLSRWVCVSNTEARRAPSPRPEVIANILAPSQSGERKASRTTWLFTQSSLRKV